MNSLPSDIYQSILGEWSSLSSVCSFDSAMCNVEGRKVFLEILSNNKSTLLTNEGFDEFGCIKWISVRRIKVQDCFLTDCVSVPRGFNTTRIRSLEMATSVGSTKVMTEHMVLRIVQECPCLTSLSLIGIGDISFNDIMTKFNESFLQNFETFEVINQTFIGSVRPPVVDSLKNVSFLRAYVMVDGTTDGVVFKNVCSLIRKSDTLSIKDQFSSIATRFPHTAGVCGLQCNEPIDFSVITNFLLRCPGVRSFGLNCFVLKCSTNNDKPRHIYCCEIFGGKISVTDPVSNLQPEHKIVWSDENIIEFFEKMPIISKIYIVGYPITNEIIKAMIKNSPKCESIRFKNCGSNYDRGLANNWRV
jgi:hypothetical protein